MRLSKRLETVASFVPKGCRLADIGTDHGYVPIYLTMNEQVTHAIAMDVRKGPLERAKEHTAQYHLSERIEVRLSDGLKNLRPGEADTVIIAGMGGELLIHILEEGRHVWDSVAVWVLSPQSNLYKVRYYLQQQGFCMEQETMLVEDGKYYTVMQVHRGLMNYERDIEFRYGKYLLDTRHPVLKHYLEKEIRQTEEIMVKLNGQETDGTRIRRGELLQELKQMKEAYHAMQ